MFTHIVRMSVLAVLLASCARQAGPSINRIPSSAVTGGEMLYLTQTIPLPNVEGRIDHLSVDLKGQRLFVAALGNNTVEIVDLRSGKLLDHISGLSEPQGVLFVPEVNRLYVANGGNGRCDIFDGTSFAEVGHVELPGDADNIRYDSARGSVVVGYGDGGLSSIDVHTGKVQYDIKLGGHPESFQGESAGPKIFVNIPSLDQLAVVDGAQQKVMTTWLMTQAVGNYPMALDESEQRLFVGFRFPARLGVFDTETGNLVAGLDAASDLDDIFYDATHRIVFAIGGEGVIDMFSQQNPDHYKPITPVQTAAGARTGLWVPEQNRMYVAAPHQGAAQAQVLVYELRP